MITVQLFLYLVVSLTLHAQTSITSLSAADFKNIINKNNGILLDTRSKGEFARGHIAGARLVDLQDPGVQQTLLALPKDKPLYLYCYSGARSMKVANFLVQNGYTMVYNMQSGLVDWNNSGFALETGQTVQNEPQPDFVSVADYQKLTAEKGLVFVDFYAPWCAPCKQMMPMMEELKKEYAGRVNIVKVNSDASKETAQKAGVTAVPYLVLYKNGKVVYTKTEAVKKDELQKTFNDNLK